MPLRILAVPALLAVLASCGDGPAELTAPVEARMAPPPDVTVSMEAVRAVVDLLADPFVRELLDRAGPHTRFLGTAARDAATYGTQDHMLTLSRALVATRSDSFVPSSGDDAEEDADAEILGAALGLVLDDAATLLEPPPSPEQKERGQDVVHH